VLGCLSQHSDRRLPHHLPRLHVAEQNGRAAGEAGGELGIGKVLGHGDADVCAPALAASPTPPARGAVRVPDGHVAREEPPEEQGRDA
jgi:hypothetical protein